MLKNLLNSKNIEEISFVEKCLFKYLFDLKTHFSLTNADLIKILESILIVIKKDNRLKRWWKFL